MGRKPGPALRYLPIAILIACSGAAPADDEGGGNGGGGADTGSGGTSGANAGSGANGASGADKGGSGGTSGQSATAPEVFGALAGVYEADLSSATAIVCGSLLPIFDGTVNESLSRAGIACGNAGVHRVEVTEAGLTRFLDTTGLLEFAWDYRATEMPPSSTRLNGGVTYNGTGQNLTLMYPSADNLSFDSLVLRFHQTATQEPGELTAPLARIE